MPKTYHLTAVESAIVFLALAERGVKLANELDDLAGSCRVYPTPENHAKFVKANDSYRENESVVKLFK